MGRASDNQVEESRQLLRHILTRRGFLATAGGVVAGAGGLGLVGCGGTADPSPPPLPPPPPPPPPGVPEGLQTIAGKVTIPGGSSLKIGDLSVDILTQTVPVSTTGSFTIGIATTGPSLGLLLDATGEPVLMSVFNPTDTAHTISTQTTAVALLYYATSGYAFPGAASAKILELLTSDPAVATLEAAIAVAVAADPHAIANAAPTLSPAVLASLRAILGEPSPTKGPAVRPIATTGPVPTLMLLSPSEEQTGVMVNQDIDTTALLISNTKRRRCKVYLYKTATLAKGVTTDINPAELVQDPIDLDSTENLSLFTALKDFTTFFHGKSPWSPVDLPKIPLALVPDTDRTSYQVIVLAASWKVLAADTFEPSFFREPRFVKEVARWRRDDANLFYVAVLGDVLLPIFCFFGGVGVIVASQAVVSKVVLDAATTGAATFARIISQLRYGSIPGVTEALAIIVEDAFKSDISREFWKGYVQKVVGTAEARAIAAESKALLGTRFSRAAKMFLKVFPPLFAAGAILDGFDLGAVILDIYNSDIGASWNALLIRQLLNLRPQNPRVSSGERVNFAISNPAGVTGTFEYDWVQTSLFATLSAVGEVAVGASITTSKLNVELVTTGSDVDPIRVSVTGYDKSTGARLEIGRAETIVKFLLPAEIIPRAVVLLAKGDRQFFIVTVGGTPPPSVGQYRWTLTGTSGSIGGASVVTTTIPQITYLATSSGHDQLHVDVLDPAGVLIAKGDATVTVAAESFIEFVVAGTWDRDQAPANGAYRFVDGEVARTPLPDDKTLDLIFFAYDFGVLMKDGKTIGAGVALLVKAGEPLRADRRFSKFVSGSVQAAGDFQLLLSLDLDNVDNAPQRTPGDRGSLKIDSVDTALDGTMVVSYSFRVENGLAGEVVGSGVGRWK